MYSQGKSRIFRNSKKGGRGGGEERRKGQAGGAQCNWRQDAGLSFLQPLPSSPGESYPGTLLEDIQMSEWKKRREKVLSFLS